MICVKKRKLKILLIFGAFLVLILRLTVSIDGVVSERLRVEAKLASKIGELENPNQYLQQKISNSRNEYSNMQKTVDFQMYDAGSNGTKLEFFNQHSDIHKCEVIHVATVCTGHSLTRDFVTLLKSVLFYRKNPLHFHFIVDKTARTVLEKLLNTWNLNGMEWSFYSEDSITRDLKNIPNKNYSENKHDLVVKGLMKLALPSILPENLHKVIVLDTDMIFASDIAELWKLFTGLVKEAFGLVENQSYWYLSKLWKNHQLWPALGQGFNTGVILINLNMLRDLDWMSMWRKIAEEERMTMFATSQADQEIINSVLKKNPHLVKTLPCKWNVHLSDNTRNEYCYSEVTDVKIIHWNSSEKLNVKNKDIEFFRKFYLTFLKYVRSLLRKELFGCGNTNLFDTAQEQIRKTYENDECFDFRREGVIEHTTHLYYFDYIYKPEKLDVTLVTQLSIDRFKRLETICKHWEGPISVAIYMSDADTQLLRNALESKILMTRTNIGYHIVYKDGQYYPMNYLRNVAKEQTQSEFMFLTDIDFLPMYGLYEYLKEAIKMTDLRNQKKIRVCSFTKCLYDSYPSHYKH